jgi:signal transduction histidine kinase/ligand-binding sensor domain-containing protein
MTPITYILCQHASASRRIRRFCWLVALSLTLYPCSRTAQALNPGYHISQYGHSAWRLQDGVFPGAPSAIAQTSDGYLWIGTGNGLFRFDGVRFTPYSAVQNQPLSTPVIISLLGSRDGSLWIGTPYGLARWKDGELTTYASIRSQVNNIREDKDGGIWVSRSRMGDSQGPLCRVREAGPQCFGKNEGIPQQTALFQTPSADGAIWISGNAALTRWTPTSIKVTQLPALANATQLNGIDALEATSDGALWVGMVFAGPGRGLQKLVNDVFEPITAGGFDSSNLRVTSLLLDRENVLWVGTLDAGIYRLSGGKVDHYQGAEGLSGNTVQSIFEDHDGNIWIATTSGIDRFRNLRVVSVSSQEGLSASAVTSVLAAKDGTVWFGNSSFLDALRNDGVNSTPAEKVLSGRQFTSLFQDHAGRIWVGIDNDVAIRQNDGSFSRVRTSDGKPIGTVIAMTEDAERNIWAQVVSPFELIRIQNDKVQEVIPQSRDGDTWDLAPDPRGGIWLGLRHGDLGHYYQGALKIYEAHTEGQHDRVYRLAVGSDGSVFGATQRGVIALVNDRVRRMTEDNGLPCNEIYSLLLDARQSLWLYASCGLIEIERADFLKWLSQPSTRVRGRVFDAFDGVFAGRSAFQPTSALAPDGRIWFVNDQVAQFIDPAHLSAKALPPPVHIEQVIADRMTFQNVQTIQLPALTRNLEVDYTAPSLTLPERVHFRYRLDGIDSEWHEANTRRQAFYTDPSPGSYNFQVQASNEDGAWGGASETLYVRIQPAFFQTAWFRAACVAGFLLLLGGLYQLRLRQIGQAFNARLEERVGERNRIARDLHDTLLQSFQGLLLRFQTAYALFDTRPTDAKEVLGNSIDQTAQAITEGREAVQGLRASTVESNDLAQAIRTLGEQLVAEASSATSAGLHVAVEGTSRNLHPIVRDEIYRIASEALRNAYRHAEAKQIEVEFRYDERQFRLRVRDDGKGIDAMFLTAEGRSGHFGLHGMRERAKSVGGKLTVWTAAESGTEIELIIPAARAYAASSRRSWFAEKFSVRSAQGEP